MGACEASRTPPWNLDPCAPQAIRWVGRTLGGGKAPDAGHKLTGVPEFGIAVRQQVPKPGKITR